MLLFSSARYWLPSVAWFYAAWWNLIKISISSADNWNGNWVQNLEGGCNSMDMPKKLTDLPCLICVYLHPLLEWLAVAMGASCWFRKGKNVLWPWKTSVGSYSRLCWHLAGTPWWVLSWKCCLGTLVKNPDWTIWQRVPCLESSA